MHTVRRLGATVAASAVLLMGGIALATPAHAQLGGLAGSIPVIGPLLGPPVQAAEDAVTE